MLLCAFFDNFQMNKKNSLRSKQSEEVSNENQIERQNYLNNQSLRIKRVTKESKKRQKVQQKQMRQKLQAIDSQKKQVAQLAAQIIKMIAYQEENITEMSLRQKIIKKIKEKESQAVNQKLLSLFQGGVKLNKQVFNQKRVKKGSQEIDGILRTTFCPTISVSRQVFLNIFQKNQHLFYGQSGVSKTFSFILFHELSNLIQEAAIANLIGRQHYVPKLFYYSININEVVKLYQKEILKIETKQPTQKIIYPILKRSAQTHFENCLIQQCKQFGEEINDFQGLMKQYEKKCITRILVFEQVNVIASYIRRKDQLLKYRQQIMYQAAIAINTVRSDYENLFSYVIFCSSENIEYFDEEIKKQLILIDSSYEYNIEKDRLDYLGGQRKTRILELSDIILFQYEKKYGKIPQKFTYKNQNDQKKEIKSRDLLQNILQHNRDHIFLTYYFIKQYLEKVQQKYVPIRKKKFQKGIESMENFTDYMNQNIKRTIYMAKELYMKGIRNYLTKDKKLEKIRKTFLYFILMHIPPERVNQSRQNQYFIEEDRFSIFYNVLEQKMGLIIKNIDINSLYDHRLFALNYEQYKVQSVIPYQYLSQLLSEDQSSYLQIFYFALQQIDFPELMDNCSKRKLLERVFWKEISSGKNLIFKLDSEKKVLIDDQLFGLKAFNYKDYKLQSRLAMLNILAQEKINFFAIPSIQKNYASKIQKDQIFNSMNWSSKAVDFFIIQKEKQAEEVMFKIHIFDIGSSKRSSQIQNKCAALEDLIKELQDKNKKIITTQIQGKKNIRIKYQLYGYVVGPAKNSQNKEMTQTLKLEQNIKYISLKSLIQQNDDSSQWNGTFKRFIDKMIQAQR